MNSENNTIQGYELSDNQKNLWLLDKENQQKFYNQTVLKFQTGISFERLKEILFAVLQKHEALSFTIRNDKNFSFPLQVPLTIKEINLPLTMLNEEEIKRHIQEQTAYEPTMDLPVRFHAFGQSGTVDYLQVKVAALWSDAYSLVLFCSELSKAVKDLDAYKIEKTEKVDYVNYCAWQNDLINEPEEEAAQFWSTYAYTLNQRIIRFSKNTEADFHPVKNRIVTLEQEPYQSLKKYCQELDVELSTVLLNRFANYLSAFSENEITIGYLPFERPYEELNHTLGYLSKTLPFRYRSGSEPTFLEQLKSSQKLVNQLKSMSDYFSLNRENSAQNRSIFNYCFECIDVSSYQNEGHLPLLDLYTVQDAFDIKLTCIDTGNQLILELYSDEGVYDQSSIHLITEQLKQCLATTALSSKIGLTPYEEKLIADVNNTAMEYPALSSVLDLFEKQAHQHPEAIALLYGDKKMNYKEVNHKAEQFAAYLQVRHHLKKGDAVCILSDRSEWLIITILGTLKAGGYYVPVDTAYPAERIQFILNDCASKILVCSELPGDTDFGGIRLINPSDEAIYETALVSSVQKPGLEDIAYCIYTSGSTGTPKGCLITNRNLLHYIQWANDYYFDSRSPLAGNWGLVTSVSFDLTVTSIFTSLTRGKKLWIAGNHADTYTLLRESFTNKEIDALKLTPTHLSMLKDLDIKETCIQLVICGGEQLTLNQVNNLRRLNPDISIYNEYGPTESTVGCIVKKIASDDTHILIGKPIANTKVFVMDENGDQVPIGIAGEICLAGNGLAKGYLNREELSNDRFSLHPQLKTRIYKTGDLARWLPDGNIEYIGRKDSQVKVRGYRVELNEVENILLSNESIREAVILAVDAENDNKKLIAFFTSDQPVKTIDLRHHLLKKVPNYMVPDDFIQVEQFRTTVNGKVDKQYLLGLKKKSAALSTEYVAPTNEVEEKLVEIWKAVLSKEKVGIIDDFFESGGNSLLVMKLINRISFEFGIKMDYKQLFAKPTISGLSLEIQFLIQQQSVNEDQLIELDI